MCATLLRIQTRQSASEGLKAVSSVTQVRRDSAVFGDRKGIETSVPDIVNGRGQASDVSNFERELMLRRSLGDIGQLVTTLGRARQTRMRRPAPPALPAYQLLLQGPVGIGRAPLKAALNGWAEGRNKPRREGGSTSFGAISAVAHTQGATEASAYRPQCERVAC